MKTENIMMRNFSLTTYESECSYPEVRIDCAVMFPTLTKHITNINIATIKRAILNALYYEAIKLDTPTTTSSEK